MHRQSGENCDIEKMKFNMDLSLQEEDHRHRSFQQLRKDLLRLSEITDISTPQRFAPTKGPLGGIGGRVKTLISKMLSPIIRLFFARQIEINQTTLFLATKIAALESRIQALEEANAFKKQ